MRGPRGDGMVINFPLFISIFYFSFNLPLKSIYFKTEVYFLPYIFYHLLMILHNFICGFIRLKSFKNISKAILIKSHKVNDVEQTAWQKMMQ